MNTRSSLRGVTLIEALVALLISTFGMLAMVGLQGKLRGSADLAKQRGEATRMAQQEMERLRSYSVLDLPAPPEAEAPAGTLDYASIATPAANANAGVMTSNATFTMNRRVTDWPDTLQKSVRVRVDWDDRSGAAQFVQIDSFIARADPALSGSLGIAPQATPTRGSAASKGKIPAGAKDLGDHTSIFKPQLDGTVAWVFNNLTGVITGRCTVGVKTQTSALTAADAATCRNNTSAYLLSGFVRFSYTGAPNPDLPGDKALPLHANLELTSTGHPTPPQCFDDASDSVLSARKYVSFYCIVYPNNAAKPSWSGQLTIALADAKEKQICRYSADYDGDSRISNIEHPLSYEQVNGSLTQQNFLVIGKQSCPAGHTVNLAAGRFAHTATVRHQPDGEITPIPVP